MAELQHLWADADHYDPIELPYSECVAWVKKWIEKRRVPQFLRGLNSEYEGRRAAMFHKSTLPSFQEAIAAMSQEESRLKLMRENDSPSPRPIFAATGLKEVRKCFNCGDTRYLIRDCPILLKPNRGRGRGNNRSLLSGGRGRGGRSNYRANAATSEREFEVPSMGCEEQTQLKGKLESNGDKDLEPHSGDFINFVYKNEGNYAHASLPTQISKSNWILDSEASKHVTGTSNEFVSHTKYPPTRKETLQTADGT